MIHDMAMSNGHRRGTSAWQHRTLRNEPTESGLPRYDPNKPTTLQLPVISIQVEQTPAEFSTLYAALERQIALMEERTLIGARRMAVDVPYVLGITSAIPGEGKTTTALHLALTAARNTFKKVCLIDLSLGNGDLGRRMGLEETGRGLIGVLEDTETVVPTLQMAECENLVIIPAGSAPSNPAKLARSPRVAQLLGSARTTFDIVIVDLPAVSTDNVMPLVGQVDGLLVVARAGVTPRDVVANAIETLGRDRVIGVTLNRFQGASPRWVQDRFGRA
jgi:Mrp family chromosome partitioning ATPase